MGCVVCDAADQEDSLETEFMRAAVFSARGQRMTNEDAHILMCDFCTVADNPVGLFAVLDGHGGAAVSLQTAKQLPRILRREIHIAGESNWFSAEVRATVLNRAMLELDTHFSHRDFALGCGTTCVLALVWRERGDAWRTLFANVGDSRGLMIRSGQGLVGVTQDHKPDLESERRRITDCGGRVDKSKFGPARVDGDLSVSRTLGDIRMKQDSRRSFQQQRITCMPDIYEYGDCRPGDIVVLACDGAFDVLSSQAVADVAIKELSAGSMGCIKGDPATVVKEVVNRALQSGSRDNVTCLGAQILGGHPPSPLRQVTL